MWTIKEEGGGGGGGGGGGACFTGPILMSELILGVFLNGGSLLLQVHSIPGVCKVGEQPSGPIKLTWRQGQPAPEGLSSYIGEAVVHGSTAYFSREHNVYLYTCST